MKIRTVKRKRIGTGLLTVLLAVLLLFPQSVFAAQQDAVREVHKVPAGEKLYCFFVTNNVVLTPAQVAALEDDEALIMEVLKKAGLSMSESSCRVHPEISMEAWLAAGNTLQLSEINIIKIRQAAPKDGEPVKLHLDLRFSVKEEDQETPPAPEEPAEDPADEPGDTPAEDPAEDPADEPGDTPAEDPADTPADTPSDTPADTPSEGSGGTPADTPAETPSDEPSDTPADTPSEEPAAEPVITHTYHSTFKKTSPEILFVVIATEADAATAEDSCAPAEETPEEPAEPDIPIDLPDDFVQPDEPAVPADILPEMRTIKMTPKKGAPIEDVLQDGEPVSLEWIEPKKTINKSDFEEFLGHIPGGGAGLGAIIGIAATGAAAAVIAVRRKRREEN